MKALLLAAITAQGDKGIGIFVYPHLWPNHAGAEAIDEIVVQQTGIACQKVGHPVLQKTPDQKLTLLLQGMGNVIEFMGCCGSGQCLVHFPYKIKSSDDFM